jgi:hypothetical protein
MLQTHNGNPPAPHFIVTRPASTWLTSEYTDPRLITFELSGSVELRFSGHCGLRRHDCGISSLELLSFRKPKVAKATLPFTVFDNCIRTKRAYDHKLMSLKQFFANSPFLFQFGVKQIQKPFALV